MGTPDSRAQPLLRLAHSPDPDDAFMWWPLFAIDGRAPRLQTGRFRFEQVVDDIESLNQRAMATAGAGAGGMEPAGALEITALSCATYPRVKDVYALTTSGSSMGEGYGPKVVAAAGSAVASVDDLRRSDVVIAVPGEGTTAFAALTLLLGRADGGGERGFRHCTVPFKRIIDEVAVGRFAAGLIIHEGQLTFESSGLRQIVDLAAWWSQTHGGLPLPLGVNAVRRDVDDVHGRGAMREIAGLLRSSVEYALAHREESVAYAMRFARDMTSELADEFIRMYVNKWTLDFGERGREAVRVFLRETHRAGITPDAGAIDFVG